MCLLPQGMHNESSLLGIRNIFLNEWVRRDSSICHASIGTELRVGGVQHLYDTKYFENMEIGSLLKFWSYIFEKCDYLNLHKLYDSRNEMRAIQCKVCPTYPVDRLNQAWDSKCKSIGTVVYSNDSEDYHGIFDYCCICTLTDVRIFWIWRRGIDGTGFLLNCSRGVIMAYLWS